MTGAFGIAGEARRIAVRRRKINYRREAREYRYRRQAQIGMKPSLAVRLKEH